MRVAAAVDALFDALIDVDIDIALDALASVMAEFRRVQDEPDILSGDSCER